MKDLRKTYIDNNGLTRYEDSGKVVPFAPIPEEVKEEFRQIFGREIVRITYKRGA